MSNARRWLQTHKSGARLKEEYISGPKKQTTWKSSIMFRKTTFVVGMTTISGSGSASGLKSKTGATYTTQMPNTATTNLTWMSICAQLISLTARRLTAWMTSWIMVCGMVFVATSNNGLNEPIMKSFTTTSGRSTWTRQAGSIENAIIHTLPNSLA